MASPLTEDEKRILLRLAREALEAAVHRRPPPAIKLKSLPERLQKPGASFVTLTRGGQLRGCIGTLERKLPLAEDVREHVVAAALDDYRFPSVKPEEVGEIEIEISVLSIPQALEYQDAERLPKHLRPGVDGVILLHGVHRATFLPQVWKKVPDAEQFLSMLCQKAMLPKDAWRRGDLQILTYQVESFHEAEFGVGQDGETTRTSSRPQA